MFMDMSFEDFRSKVLMQGATASPSPRQQQARRPPPPSPNRRPPSPPRWMSGGAGRRLLLESNDHDHDHQVPTQHTTPERHVRTVDNGDYQRVDNGTNGTTASSPGAAHPHRSVLQSSSGVGSRSPRSKDWISEGKVTVVRDQGLTCSSCWAL